MSSVPRTRRINPDFSMPRSAMTVVGSIMPTRALSSRCDRPSSSHNTRRKYHWPRVTPCGEMRRSSRRWNARLASRTRYPKLPPSEKSIEWRRKLPALSTVFRRFAMRYLCPGSLISKTAFGILPGPALTGTGPMRIILSNLCNAQPVPALKQQRVRASIHREHHAMQKAVRKKELKVIERPVSLRDMLDKLKAEGDLIESDKPV